MNCIDSDFAIAILKGDSEARELLHTLESQGDIYITSISVFELTYTTRELSKKKEKILSNLLAALDVLPLNKNSALLASSLGRELVKKGKIVHPMDLMIGAIALQHRMPLITNNVKHFSRIEGLEIISW